MSLIKSVGRFLFGREMNDLEIKVGELESSNDSLQEELKDLRETVDNNQKNYDEYVEEKLELAKRVSELGRENEVLRKYYDLDSEPSDEIKMKIHIDLEINRVKEENKMLRDEIIKTTTLANMMVLSRYSYRYSPWPGRMF